MSAGTKAACRVCVGPQPAWSKDWTREQNSRCTSARGGGWDWGAGVCAPRIDEDRDDTSDDLELVRASPPPSSPVELELGGDLGLCRASAPSSAPSSALKEIFLLLLLRVRVNIAPGSSSSSGGVLGDWTLFVRLAWPFLSGDFLGDAGPLSPSPLPVMLLERSFEDPRNRCEALVLRLRDFVSIDLRAFLSHMPPNFLPSWIACTCSLACAGKSSSAISWCCRRASSPHFSSCCFAFFLFRWRHNDVS